MTGGYLNAIRSLEGFTSVAQWDYAQQSNGYGTKARYPGEVIDRQEAERRFSQELKEARSLVDKFSPNVDKGTAAALTSLTFNAGTAWMKGGLGQAVLAGDLASVRQVFLQYNRAGGQVLTGLSHRREIEAGWIGQAAANEPSSVRVAQDCTAETAEINTINPGAGVPSVQTVQEAKPSPNLTESSQERFQFPPPATQPEGVVQPIPIEQASSAMIEPSLVELAKFAQLKWHYNCTGPACLNSFSALISAVSLGGMPRTRPL